MTWIKRHVLCKKRFDWIKRSQNRQNLLLGRGFFWNIKILLCIITVASPYLLFLDSYFFFLVCIYCYLQSSLSCYELLSALLSSSLAEGVSEIVFLPSQVGIRMRAFYPPQIPLVDGLLLLLFVFNIHIFHSVLNIIYFQDFLPVSLPFLSHRDLQGGFRGKKKIWQKRNITITISHY